MIINILMIALIVRGSFLAIKEINHKPRHDLVDYKKIKEMEKELSL